MTARTNRRTLQGIALRLFLAKGYDSVSVAEVAAAAGVSHMTFFRHFPTKDSVVVEDLFDPALAEAVAAQPPVGTALERAVRGFLQAMSSPEARQELASQEFRDRVRLVAETPALQGAVRASSALTETALSDALTPTGAPVWQARAAAGAVMGAATALLLGWASDPSAGDPVDSLTAGLRSLLGDVS